jgi:HEPN domain-containing protein
MRKAESDLANAELCLDARRSLDTACFHCQQAAEKALKAYLTDQGISFPFVHDLEKLAKLCAQHNSVFAPVTAAASDLTPYAVALRYDEEFWPTVEEARSALESARAVYGLVSGLLTSP